MRGLRWLLYALVVLTPALVGMGLMQQVQGESLFLSYPVWTDEVWYWHQAQSFAEAGFNSGYYTIKEVPAQAQFSPFNPWGMSIPVFYGSVAGLFGWSLHSIVLFNLMALMVAIALFLWALRPSVLQALACSLLLAVYPPLILYTYSSLLTVLQMAIGTGLAAGFLVVLRERHQTPHPVLRGVIYRDWSGNAASCDVGIFLFSADTASDSGYHMAAGDSGLCRDIGCFSGGERWS